MTWVLIAAPFVVALALACGFALGRLMPRADDFFSPEEAAELRKRVWERHWAENARAEVEVEAEVKAAMSAYAMGLDARGDAAMHRAHQAALDAEHAARMASGAFDMGLGHTHTDH